MEASSVDALRRESRALLGSVTDLRGQLKTAWIKRESPTHDNTEGLYEELWCNYRNKIERSVALGDSAYAFFAAAGAQGYFDEMTELFGMPQIDLMASYDGENLETLEEAFEELYRDFLG